MIGQKNFLANVDRLIANNAFPRFCVIVGQKGGGKKTICKHIVEAMGCSSYELPDVKIDTIRQMIDTSYKATSDIVYLIYDADTMSTAAKNSLLKVTEEPPNKAFIIMTIEDESLTLDTVRSRATILHIDNYLKDEIIEYAKRSFDCDGRELAIIDEICAVPGDVDTLHQYKPDEFYKYVEDTVDNIADVEGAEAFKISSKLAVKQDSTGYDVKLFLRAFMAVCVSKMHENPFMYASGVAITSKFINQLGIRGVSKLMLIDAWILEIRKAWMR